MGIKIMTEREEFQTEIEGVRFKPLQQIHDERGAVYHWLRSDSPLFSSFGEVYFSVINPGAVKAWKSHKRMTQNLVVPTGKVLVVVYDGRPNSATFQKLEKFELGENSYSLLQLPPGVWYGFKGLSLSPAVIGNCTTICHDPRESQSKPENSPEIPFYWQDS